MKPIALLLVLFASLSLADMNMDSHSDMMKGGHHDEDVDSLESMPTSTENTDNINSTESLVPIPHVMKHMHGVLFCRLNCCPKKDYSGRTTILLRISLSKVLIVLHYICILLLDCFLCLYFIQ